MSVDADLATLRDWIGDPEDYSDEDRGAAERACDACDGVEAELSRLRKERDAVTRECERLCAENDRLVERRRAAEARCAAMEETIRYAWAKLAPGATYADLDGKSIYDLLDEAASDRERS